MNTGMARIVGWGALALAVLACGGDSGPRLTFAVGGAPSEVQVWQDIVADYSRTSGVGVIVQRQPTDSDQRRQRLLVPLEAGLADPDVFLMDVIWVPQFAASGWLRPLGARMEEAGLSEAEFFRPAVELVGRHAGELVALPVYVDGGLLYYRRDLLESHGFAGPPGTWEELERQARAIQGAEGEGFWGFVWQGAQYEGLVCNFLEVAVSAGGGLMDGERLTIDSEANRRALRFLRRLVAEGISPPSSYTQMKEEEVRQTFQRGEALFERNWPYAWSLHREAGSPVAGKVGIAPLPRFEGGRPASTLGGWHVGISKTSDRPDEAWDLLAHVVSVPVQRRLAIELGWNPARVALYEDPEVLEKAPHFSTLRSVFEHLTPRPVLPYYTPFSTALQRSLNAALAGQKEAGEALREAETAARELESRYGGAG